jgi:DNA-binding MarR family transcriptional regulator
MPDAAPQASAEALEKLPPSAKLVYKTLVYEGEMTQAQLAEAAWLSSRTVRHATSQLEEQDLVRSRLSFADARQKIYSLTDEAR